MPPVQPARPSPVPRTAAFGVLTDEGLRVLVDSEALAQAVYLYRPILDDAGDVVDLEITTMNEAAHRVPLSSHITEGLRVSTVFVETEKALDAATIAWRGGRAPRYEIERRGWVAGQPMVVHYEVSTFRMGEYVVQVSIDHSTAVQLASADTRFRRMADASGDGLLLVTREPTSGQFVIAYANPAAFVADPSLRVGRRLPDALERVLVDAVDELGVGGSVRRLLDAGGVSRRVEREVTLTALAVDQMMLTVRHLTEEGVATADLERSERVLAAVGAGAFGTIAVFEPQYVAGRLAGLDLLWQSRRSDGADIEPLSVLQPSDLVGIASAMLDTGEHQRSGWVQVDTGGEAERSVEFNLVLAGDRFVLEFVERTDELAARTALAMVNATSEAQRAFLSRVSHEMRSPLNVIHGYSQLLRRLQLSPAAADHLARIEEGVERMVHIVDDLLLLGQLEQGLLRLDLQPVDLAAALTEVVATASSEPWSRPDLVRVVETGAVATTRTDRARFVTVALLALEASLAVTTGGIDLSVFVRGMKVGLSFTAASTDPVVDDVWRPFADSHVIPGAGLGLAVARGLAQALGVNLEVRTAGEGHSALLLLLDPVGEPVPGSEASRGADAS